MTDKETIESVVPNLQSCKWEITSEPDELYNCIAWATGAMKRPWWPNEDAYWPDVAPMEETVDAFVIALQTAGFVPTEDSTIEAGFEKIALYAMKDKPKHAARQLSNGEWTSKLGRRHDIVHESLDGVAGELYGNVVLFLKRPWPAK